MKTQNISWDAGMVNPHDRNRLLGQRGLVIWLTGLSGSGKSTIASALEKCLIDQGRLVLRLDGDNLRHGLNKDLGFSKEDRQENIRRIAEVSTLLADAGIIVIVAAITPHREMRSHAKQIIGAERFVEVYIKADIETCRARDPKGLYVKASNGEIEQFTGLDDPYQIPENPRIVIDTEMTNASEAVAMLQEMILEASEIKQR